MAVPVHKVFGCTAHAAAVATREAQSASLVCQDLHRSLLVKGEQYGANRERLRERGRERKKRERGRDKD